MPLLESPFQASDGKVQFVGVPTLDAQRPRDRVRVAALLTRTAFPLVRGHFGAACRNRTDDLLITSETLYRLS